eukprot:CFRG2262T1
MSDRLCIHSKGKQQAIISALDLMSCCEYCSGYIGGCEGGEPQDAYHYWKNHGIVTGDNFESGIGCQPYPFQIGLIHSAGAKVTSPQCVRNCTNLEYKGLYHSDKSFALEVYKLEKFDTIAAMWEIMTNGPISASFDVYKDFMLYKDGVYQRTSDDKLGEHTVAIIGWGTDNHGVDYWVIKNSWNRLWGHHGFFRFIRGTNDCRMEEEFVTGIPDVSKY